MQHQHQFTFVTKGYAEPPKENIKEPKVWPGHLEKCICGVRRFVTADPRLLPVEIEPTEYYGPMK
jgi:hypothetical protein